MTGGNGSDTVIARMHVHFTERTGAFVHDIPWVGRVPFFRKWEQDAWKGIKNDTALEGRRF